MSTVFSKLLLDRYHSGDSQAAGEIYARYAQRLLGLAESKLIALLKSKVDADDIAQETFQAFFALADRGEVRWDREGDLWRLLAGIAVNQVNRQVEHFSAAKRNAGREINDEVDRLVDPSLNENSISEINDLVATTIQYEKPLAKRIIVARLAGFTLKQIAAKTHRSERTIRRILQSLKARLAAEYDFDVGTEFDRGAFRELPHREQELLTANYNDFDLLQMIGAGAFGKVYSARDRRSNLRVAIKVLKKSRIGNSTSERLFLNEANHLADLDHPNIIQFLGAGPLPNGSWFIVQEYFKGDTLKTLKFEKANANVVIGWLIQLASALAYLHQKSVVHADLQPANILVNRERAKLIDFGLSVLRSDGPNPMIGGTHGFLAPEREASFAADVYSLGKVVEYAWFRGTPFRPQIADKLKSFIELAVEVQPSNRPSAKESLSIFETMAVQNRVDGATSIVDFP